MPIKSTKISYILKPYINDPENIVNGEWNDHYIMSAGRGYGTAG